MLNIAKERPYLSQIVVQIIRSWTYICYEWLKIEQVPIMQILYLSNIGMFMYWCFKLYSSEDLDSSFNLLRKNKTLLLRSFLIFLNEILFVLALNIINVSLMSIIFQLGPFISGIMAKYKFGEEYNKNMILGTLVSFVGVCIIVGFINFENKNVLLGFVLSICQSVISSYISILTKEQVSVFNIDKFQLYYFGSMVIANASPFLMIYGQEVKMVTAKQFGVLIVYTLLCIFQLLITYETNKKGKVTLMSIITYLHTIFTTLLSMWLFDEQFKFSTVLGMLFVVLGILIFVESSKSGEQTSLNIPILTPIELSSEASSLSDKYTRQQHSKVTFK
jgi:drug/metabolite transporter (DMT)-like permease